MIFHLLVHSDLAARTKLCQTEARRHKFVWLPHVGGRGPNSYFILTACHAHEQGAGLHAGKRD